MLRRLLFSILSMSSVACAPAEYAYTLEPASGWSAGQPAAASLVPPERPRGTVRLLSFGLSELTTSDGWKSEVALHVRLIVSNDSDAAAWYVDTRAQRVQIAGKSQSAPVVANADVDELPIVTVNLREQRTIDLYFPVPESIESEADLPGFDVVWQVTTRDRAVVERTAFQRVQIASPPAEAAYGYGYGYPGYWWYGPYAGVYFHHPHFTHGWGGHFTVTHHGGHYRASHGGFHSVHPGVGAHHGGGHRGGGHHR